MRRRRVQVVVALLDVFAVVAFAVGQAKQPLLQDRVLPVPQRQGKTEDLLIVADAEQAVLTPAVGAAAGGVVAERLPGGAAGAVVLADRAPLTLAQVRAPLLPSEVRWLVQARLFVHEMASVVRDSGNIVMTVLGCRRRAGRFAKPGGASAHRTGMATRPTALHWPEYLIEAGRHRHLHGVGGRLRGRPLPPVLPDVRRRVQ